MTVCKILPTSKAHDLIKKTLPLSLASSSVMTVGLPRKSKLLVHNQNITSSKNHLFLNSPRNNNPEVANTVKTSHLPVSSPASDNLHADQFVNLRIPNCYPLLVLFYKHGTGLIILIFNNVACFSRSLRGIVTTIPLFI